MSNEAYRAFYEQLNEPGDTRMRIQKMEDDTTATLKQWGRLKSHQFSEGFPDDFLSKYERDGAELETKRYDFDDLLKAGEAPPKQVMSTFAEYWNALQLVQTGNARAEALLEVFAAMEKADCARVFLESRKLARSKNLSDLTKQLNAFKSELDKAQKDAILLPIKFLFVELSGVVVVAIGAAIALPAALTAVGVITSAVAIDYAFGDRGAKLALSNADTVAKQIVVLDEKRIELLKNAKANGSKFETEALEKMNKKASTAVKGAGAAKLIVDMVVVKKKLKHYKEMIADTYSQLEFFSSEALPIAKELQGAQKTLDGYYKQVKDAMAKQSDAAKKYKAILDSMKAR